MAITKREERTIETILPYTVHCHVAEIIEEDGVETGRNHRRYGKFPGDDMTNECAEMQQAAETLWTDEVVAAYQAMVAEQQLPQ